MTMRLSQACERCWRRKQKCSREAPTCLQCRSASKDCVQRCFGATSNDPNFGSDTGIESLKSRVRAMREQVRKDRQQGTENQTISHRSSPREEREEREGPRTHESRETMQDDVAYLSLAAMAERTDRRPFLTGGISFLTLLDAATGVCGANPTLSVGSNDSLNGPLAAFRQSSTLNIELDSTEMRAAFQLFSERSQTSFPFMTSAELFQSYEEAVLSQGASKDRLALTYLGTATGILLGSNYSYKEIYATELSVRAIQIMAGIFDSASQLSIVRCLLALTIHSLYTSFGGSTWHLLGLSMTRCISAGMHTKRLSQPHPDSRAETQRSRALWTFYVLDTYVSTMLDRPFCLNECDIQVMQPSRTPPSLSGADTKYALFRHLVHYAQIMRSVRCDDDTKTGILCISINFRHWRETIPSGEGSPDHYFSSLVTRGYVELLKRTRFLHDLDRNTVLEEAMAEFSTYLNHLEQHISSHAGAVPVLEALHVFSIGVIFATQASYFDSSNTHRSPSVQRSPQTATRLLQTLNIITLISSRHAPVRSLRKIISELHQSLHQPQARDRLRLLVACSEIVISDPIQRLLFQEFPTASSL